MFILCPPVWGLFSLIYLHYTKFCTQKSTLFSKNRPLMIFPISTSKAAEEESPLPAGISEVIFASNPPKTFPLSIKQFIIPLTKAAEVSASSALGSQSPISISKLSKPSDSICMVSVPFGFAKARIPCSVAAPRIQPP